MHGKGAARPLPAPVPDVPHAVLHAVPQIIELDYLPYCLRLLGQLSLQELGRYLRMPPRGDLAERQEGEQEEEEEAPNPAAAVGLRVGLSMRLC